ncbi:DUF3993 domain-containing protein [Bacillus licheniformis]|nr:DUF3993 domain-containing protein [Bacillus licheniformis]
MDFYGTDAPEVAIPFFSYDEDTKWRRKTEAIPYMNLLEIKTTALFHIKNYQTVTLKNTGGSFKVTDIGQSDTNRLEKK